ncbi:classical arabinogalactan protein 9-like [Lactuca sativa]|uniref:classical arabinogalactan protein 9-like n=1 Tax=Lactuca sativa TaxID=4236 RepID=UPI000CD88A46|nr:classical arabinogalactan protein 9-like [Lactuca sativa]
MASDGNNGHIGAQNSPIQSMVPLDKTPPPTAASNDATGEGGSTVTAIPPKNRPLSTSSKTIVGTAVQPSVQQPRLPQVTVPLATSIQTPPAFQSTTMQSPIPPISPFFTLTMQHPLPIPSMVLPLSQIPNI